MSCSARYPVYVLLISAFFTRQQGTILFSIYLLGIILAALVALVLRRTLIKAGDVPFVMELPPYRIPTVRNILRHTWNKGAQYLKKMGGIILLASMIIWLLGYFPRNGKLIQDFEHQAQIIAASFDSRINTPGLDETAVETLQSEKTMAVDSIMRMMESKQQELSFIGMIGQFIEPVMRPLGFDWKMSVSLIAGAAAKEVVVSTMGVLYEAGSSGDNSGLVHRIQQQTYTEGPRKGEYVFTPLVAFSFMVFVLIYFPCVAVIAAVRKESGQWKWAIFVAAYTTILAWVMAFAIYQLGSLFY